MNTERSGFKHLMRRIDAGAARLNPGLSAIAIVLLTLVTAEAATRIGSLWAQLQDRAVQQSPDPALPTPGEVRAFVTSDL